MTDIAEDQAAVAESIVTQGISALLGSATASLDADTSIVVAYAINTYVETMHRMGGWAPLHLWRCHPPLHHHQPLPRRWDGEGGEA